MNEVAGRRPSADIEPCELHTEASLVVSCRSCRVWWAYREALRAAEHYRDRFNEERRRRLKAERGEGR